MPLPYQQAAYLKSYGLARQLPKSDVPEIAFAGRSNVGKSSLLNKLFGRKNLARVSSMPGKTVTINFYQVGPVHFVDLPGYGYAKVAKTEKDRWSELMEHYFTSDRPVELVVQLIDLRHPPTKQDLQMVNMLIDHGFPFVVALTKADKLNVTQRKQRLEALQQELPCADQIQMVVTSTLTGEGMDTLRGLIDSLFEEEEESQGSIEQERK